MDTLLNVLSIIVNSPVGFIVAMLGCLTVLGCLLWKALEQGEAWRGYEGTIITAIKLAEKAIPDDTPNRGLRRLDEALRFVLQVYRDEHPRKPPSDDLVHQLKEGIQIKHEQLERLGNLRPRN